MKFHSIPCIAATLVIVGCGQSTPYALVAVEGVVTLDGAPLSRAIVTFQPVAPGNEIAGPGSVGRTDDQGRFALTTVRDEPGAVVGTHKITILPMQDGDELTPVAKPAAAISQRPNIPARYNYQSTLTFTVPPEGAPAADFALTSDP